MDASHGFEVGLATVRAGDPSAAGQTERGRARRPMVVWLLALGSIVVAASAGRLVAAPPEARVAAVASAPVTIAGRSPVPALGPLPEFIVLSSPAVANMLVTTRELEVRGYLLDGGGTIRVTLEARGNRIIDEATISPALVPGERPTVGRHTQFGARFGLPNPRPNGRMVLQVALIADDGRVLDVIRRPFRVGPLLETPGG